MKRYYIVLLFIGFLLIRLLFVISFPPFTDESLYVRWGQLMVYNPTFRFASIQYLSRQPLALWFFGFGAIGLKNPLLGARLVMLLTSIPTFFLINAITRDLYSQEV